MADPTTYTIEEVIALPKGTTPWYAENQDAYRHIKNTMDVVADISGGGEPGFGSPIDVRHYVQDTSGSNTNYVGVTRPACTPTDALVVGIQIILDVEVPNQGVCTLDIGTAEGAVNIKQYGEANALQDPVEAALIGPTLIVYDGSVWVLDKSALPGGPGPEGPPGPPGIGLNMLGEVPTVSQLPGYPSSYGGEAGDTYLVKDTNNFYTWTEADAWMNIGHIQTLEPPFDLSENALGDLGDVSVAAASDNQVLYWNAGDDHWEPKKITHEMILDGTITGLDLAEDSVGQREISDESAFNMKGVWTFVEPIIGDGSQLTNVGMDLGNAETWTHGQYNQLHIPQKSGSGFTSRFTWDAETYPVASLSDAVEPLFMCAPDNPSVNGMFVAITWLSVKADQAWTLDPDKFGADVLPPENTGVDVTRIFWSKFGKWYDV